MINNKHRVLAKVNLGFSAGNLQIFSIHFLVFVS